MPTISPLVLIFVKIGLALALLTGAVHWWHSHEDAVYQRGYDAAVAARKAADESRKIADAKDSAKKQAALETKFEDHGDTMAKQGNAHEKSLSVELDRARAGASGLRCPASNPGVSVRKDAAPKDSGVAAAPEPTEGANLLPGTAERILRIAGDTASLVHDFNDLQYRYNEARKTCNAE